MAQLEVKMFFARLKLPEQGACIKLAGSLLADFAGNIYVFCN